ncbi:hypothetical protein DSO57_1039102 [Entomophthora muscae]|uniref:Uncharacterized protein n=1 Tax=Entomophthora muscae TaxID=34485 RepID=A0ACC2RPD7_9FUNG|nr:hypothetical protein DSO57_1039102 [Entomophthora muscae]
MILGSHNSQTFLSFLQLVQEHRRRTSPGFTNAIVLDNVGLHKVADILEEFPMIDTNSAEGPQQLAVANLRLLFLPAYLPFLNPIEEVFGWLKQVVKQGTPTGTEGLFNLLQARIHTSHLRLWPNSMATLICSSPLALPVRIDNSPPLEPQAQERESNPEPGSPQAARPRDCGTAHPHFSGGQASTS